VLDFGAARDGVPASKRGRRVIVDADGMEMDERFSDLDADAEV
jgi:F-box and WD-40 domain protein CDC4